MSRCGLCENSVSRKQGIFCSGTCKNIFHIDCVKIPGELVNYISSVAGLQWRCNTCRFVDNKFNEKKIMDFFEDKCKTLFSELSDKFEKLKNEFLTSSYNKISEMVLQNTDENSSLNKPTYAEKVADSQKMIVTPKNPKQGNKQTKADVMRYMNPVNQNLKLSNVKHVKNGGILLDCVKSDNLNLLQETVKKELSTNYDIHILKNNSPQLRLVGITDEMDAETFRKYLVKQNEDIFLNASELKIVRIWPTKKNPDIFQAQLQVDKLTFKNIFNRGHILIGLDRCTVYEAIEIPRCFKCNGFFHSKNNCSRNITCPVCSAEHEVKDCSKNSSHACINCINLKNKENIDIDVSHSVWEYDKCFAYKKALDKYKFDMFGSSST